MSVSPLIGVVAGAAAAIAMTLLIILGLAIKHCPRRQSTNDQHYGIAHGSLISECSPKETLSTFSRPSPASEERNPDLIPLKEGEHFPTHRQVLNSKIMWNFFINPSEVVHWALRTHLFLIKMVALV